jgi:hypothetical protein
MVGVRYRRSLFPGFSDTAEYAFRCSGNASAAAPERRDQSFRLETPAAAGEVTITARLLYRKVDQYLLNFMFGESAGLTMPVAEMARAEVRIVVRPAPRRAASSTADLRRVALR